MREFVAKFAAEEHVASFDDLARVGVNPTPRQRKEISERVQREKNPIVLNLRPEVNARNSRVTSGLFIIFLVPRLAVASLF
jgi:hypothetical protein